MKLQGVYPILATTFHDDGSLDLDSQARLVAHLLESGAHGLGLFGNAGEGYTLDADERRRIFEVVRRETAGRVPLVVSTGATGTDLAVRQSREAEQAGADALMVLPPYLLRPDAEGLVRYFEAISNAVAIPIMVQDAPLLTQVPMPAALLARLARELERVTYVKIEAPPTAPKVSAVLQQAGGKLTVFGGLNGQFFIEEVQRGARGTMPASDMTALYVEVWNRLEAGDAPGAWETFTRMLPLVRFELQPGLGVSAVKHNLVAKRIIAGARVRHPTVALDAAGRRELQTLRSLL